jgi:hypothetical protein
MKPHFRNSLSKQKNSFQEKETENKTDEKKIICKEKTLI